MRARPERARPRALGRNRPRSAPGRRILDGDGSRTLARRSSPTGGATRRVSKYLTERTTELELEPRPKRPAPGDAARGTSSVGAARPTGPQPAPIDEITTDLDRRGARAARRPASPSSPSTPANGDDGVDRDAVERAFAFACERHADQTRRVRRGLHHPPGRGGEDLRRPAARHRDALRGAAARHRRGHQRRASTRSRAVRRDRSPRSSTASPSSPGSRSRAATSSQAENYRKMMVAMATDVRVILIKLADRLHNMRTLEALPKQKQIEKARETLEIYAPARPSPGDPRDQVGARGPLLPAPAPAQVRRDQEAGRPAARRARGLRRRRRASSCAASSPRSGSRPQISGRAKHFYSIYSKMTKKGREFNEIYDLTAMRVIVGSVKDCYGAIGIIHSLWKPLPGRFKDFIATPKLNLYQALHTTVIGPEGRPLEIQIRTPEMHELAEYGIAAHVIYKEGAAARQGRARAGQDDLAAPAARGRGRRRIRPSSSRRSRSTSSRTRSSSSRRAARSRTSPRARRRSTSPTRSTPTSATAASAPRSTARSCRCTTSCSSGDIVEILTAKQERGPSRDWLAARAHAPRPQQDPRLPHAGAPRGRRAARPRGASERRCASRACRRSGSPARRCSPTSSARSASARPTTSTSPSARARSRRRPSSTS